MEVSVKPYPYAENPEAAAGWEELLAAAKNVIRVAPYKNTLALVALRKAVDQVDIPKNKPQEDERREKNAKRL